MTGINNRIEEHSHYWEDGRTYAHSHKQGKKPHGHHGSRYCQLFPQPLDDKELKKRIEVEIVKYMMRKGAMIKLPWPLSKTILALLQPKIEEARREIIKTFSKYTEGDIYGDAKTEEYMLFQIPVKVWQAVGGE